MATLFDKLSGDERALDLQHSSLREAKGKMQDVFGAVESTVHQGVQFMSASEEEEEFNSDLLKRLRGHETHLGGLDAYQGLQELQPVNAWRSPYMPAWTPWSQEMGIVHRLHREDGTVTVQFLRDQYRMRMPVQHVKPINPITPKYPRVYLKPGEQMPSDYQCQAMHEQEEAHRRHLEMQGISPPVVDNHYAEDDLPPKKVIQSDRWGIPTPTLVALRNRSIPMHQVTGVQGPHFYSKLYENQFYPSKPERVFEDGQGSGDKGPISQHYYVPLQGPPLQQMKDGGWRIVPADERPAGLY